MRDFVLFAILATATVTLVRTATPAESPATTNPQSAIPIPDFSGLWAKLHLDIESPLSGPGPVVNKFRMRQIFDIDGRPLPAATAPFVSAVLQAIGDYTNPILKPAAAEVVKRRGEKVMRHALPERTQPVLARRRACRFCCHRDTDAPAAGADHDPL